VKAAAAPSRPATIKLDRDGVVTAKLTSQPQASAFTMPTRQSLFCSSPPLANDLPNRLWRIPKAACCKAQAQQATNTHTHLTSSYHLCIFPQIFCYDGDEGWSPLQLLGLWAPLSIHVASSSTDAAVTGTAAKRANNNKRGKGGKGSDSDSDAAAAQEQVAADGTAAPAIATRAASEDDLHHAVEGMVLRLLNEGSGDATSSGGVDAEAIVSGAPSRLPRWFPLAPVISLLGGAGACPRPWASDRSTCSLYASQYGRTCVAVSAAGSARALPTGAAVTVTTSCALRPELLTLLGVAALLLFMSGEFGKSKLFQYAAGAALGVSCGALLAVVAVMRRVARSKTAVAVATVAYAGGVLALLRVRLFVLQLCNVPRMIKYFSTRSICEAWCTSHHVLPHIQTKRICPSGLCVCRGGRRRLRRGRAGSARDSYTCTASVCVQYLSTSLASYMRWRWVVP
jgi:hypothetical protein